VPSLTSGSHSWLNIQPLLRHSFLHLYNHTAALEERAALQSRESGELREACGRNAGEMARYAAGLVEGERRAREAEVAALGERVRELEGRLAASERAREKDKAEVWAKFGELEAAVRAGGGGGGRLGPGGEGHVKVEGEGLGVSMRLDGPAEVSGGGGEEGGGGGGEEGGEAALTLPGFPAQLVDKHLFPSSSCSTSSAPPRVPEASPNAHLMTVMSDVGKIRDELSFKCDGAFVKSVLEGKANKQSVADALHAKANKRSVAREVEEIRGLVRSVGGKLQRQIEEVAGGKAMPVGKISSTVRGGGAEPSAEEVDGF
jgi:hypothetical protein